ncbi:MAG: ABC transporter ATP-binding protein [Nitratireductor sp.]|nr:ABC transporter ATP-binding protein [Nitratireductor sp.]
MEQPASDLDKQISGRTERIKTLRQANTGGEIKFDNVRKEFVTKTFRTLAIEKVDLTINPGEFVCLLGRSGCGKSTMLNMLAGFIDPSEGQVLVDGNAVQGPGLDRGIVAQNGALFPWLTALANVEFGMRMKGVPKAERTQEARRLLRLFGLESFENSYPLQLSGGMQQRVAIARAMAVAPEILLMDEPFGALDDITRHTMQEELLDAWMRTNTTAIFVTHSISEAVILADRVVVMAPRPGRVVADIAIDLPDPRDPATPSFTNYYKEIRQAIGSE